MKVLIAYGSVEGQTRKIAERIAERIRNRGEESTLYDTECRPRHLAVDVFDAVIVASSVHQALHQISVRDFVAAHRALLEDIPSAFVSVSLSSAFRNGGTDAQNYVDYFFENTGWHPTYYIKVAGALRYSEYDFFKEQILRHAVFKDRLEIVDGHDHEFTDWSEVNEFIDRFLQHTKARSRTSPVPTASKN
ncbi:Protoporphyrinogen oxidase [Candidatus Filomicrobium marinum]|uniref:Protoporphyrinogen oxidase n=2 Tax=Filomicrobium TaxID=119044 RepID=A0A0D6JL12_9HYPH|nr:MULTISPECIES: flavodoxin domain-containing protein [Filomicrobium]CFX58869.1 Protoporphyrinogen oxidase [Candidatus Filomicrobium marinum]CPR22345.1 Protoporphyrinogen oxidase [Candidatus Filomicrobium marinum]SDO87791.1 protoporphyrinogen oxidase [Filomicrobium insigne]